MDADENCRQGETATVKELHKTIRIKGQRLANGQYIIDVSYWGSHV